MNISFEVRIDGRLADYGKYRDEGDMNKAIFRAEGLSRDYKNVTVTKIVWYEEEIWPKE